MKPGSPQANQSTEESATARTGPGSEDPRDIPRQEWKALLDGFSSTHQNWPTDVEVFQSDQTSHVQIHGLPMEGVFVEGEPPGGTVSLDLGQETAHHLTHSVARAVRITSLSKDALEIDAADLGRVVIRCHRP